MNKQEIRMKIENFINQGSQLNLLELKAFHHQLEKINAHNILEDKDDQTIKDVELLVRSAIFLKNLGIKQMIVTYN